MTSNTSLDLLCSAMQKVDTEQTKLLAEGPRSSHDRADGSLSRRRYTGLQENLPAQQAPSLSDVTQFHATVAEVTPARQRETVGMLQSGQLSAVVKVSACICHPNYDLPWQMKQEFQSTSTAFAIPGKRLLTVAHGLLFHTVVRVKKRSSDVFFIARVLCIAEECDLAMLAVEDDSFWEDLPSLTIGSLPALQDSVTTVGYPISGGNICITSGVTSRIELRDGFLIIQIDAAINAGNSGGPAFDSVGNVVGVAFQKYSEDDNTGFLIASDVVNHFLDDYNRNGRYTGLCTCGFNWQTLPSTDIRRYLKMRAEDKGVLVLNVAKKSPAYNIIKEDDVILFVDGHDISNTGTIPHISGERLYFQFIISQKFTGDRLSLQIMRDGKKMEVGYNVEWTHDNEIVKKYAEEKNPEYYMIGGLVFMALSEPYLNYCYGPTWKSLPYNIIELLGIEYEEEDCDQFVILSKVINDEVNVDYAHIYDQRLVEVNGTKVKSLVHLRELISQCEDEFLRFDLDFEIVVLDRKKALDADRQIQDIHHIPHLSRLYVDGDDKETTRACEDSNEDTDAEGVEYDDNDDGKSINDEENANGSGSQTASLEGTLEERQQEKVNSNEASKKEDAVNLSTLDNVTVHTQKAKECNIDGKENGHMEEGGLVRDVLSSRI